MLLNTVNTYLMEYRQQFHLQILLSWWALTCLYWSCIVFSSCHLYVSTEKFFLYSKQDCTIAYFLPFFSSIKPINLAGVSIAFSSQVDGFYWAKNWWKICGCTVMFWVLKKMSVLTYRWQLEKTLQRQYKQVNAHHDNRICNMELLPIFQKISIDNVQKHCLIVPFEENSHFIM